MSNSNYENIYKAFYCFSEATNSAYSAVNTFLELPNVFNKYPTVISLIFSKTATLDSNITNIIKNGVIIYDISTALIGAVNTFYKDKKLVDKILKDGQNAIDKLIETTTYLSPIVTDITNSYLVDPYKEENSLLFDLQIPNSTSSDYYKLSGTESITLAEIEYY
ncbi:hypothetical protein RPATATE_0044 [Rickettsia parkeri str. Tate's Hell]|uniref:Uncharacterized protein n=1 Tax=Rickettsia parkeri str. Tate's Hell TaxID=1359189 RepID=A0ABR5DS57_RICPA|nr:DUF5424 family protein [Rickettsia parkeri]AFC74259.1 hypothetical protein MC1_00375 [Rickettsia parkeri str. Portsmouth]KJV94025.1 hypothetical protein RPAGB_0092 [Rickettsia parkeri str. Grand Bay]KJV95232.1 hypothetical protein RPAAT24_0878 [Rickettsia parkeri str. AT\